MFDRTGECCDAVSVRTINVNVLSGSVKEKKKKVPAVPETLKKKRKNFAELRIKRLRKKFAQKMVSKFFCGIGCSISLLECQHMLLWKKVQGKGLYLTDSANFEWKLKSR